MDGKKEDLRVQRTKDAIRDAFKEMVCELPYEKITVKAISDRAKINRNTFYLHYEAIDDVLFEIQGDYMSRYLETVRDLNFIEHQEKIVRTFFEFMEAQDDFFKRITCDSRFDYIRERMQKKVMAHTHERTKALHDKVEAVQNIVREYNNTTLYLYRQWVADGRKIPLEEMIALATTLVERGMRGFAEMR